MAHQSFESIKGTGPCMGHGSEYKREHSRRRSATGVAVSQDELCVLLVQVQVRASSGTGAADLTAQWCTTWVPYQELSCTDCNRPPTQLMLATHQQRSGEVAGASTCKLLVSLMLLLLQVNSFPAALWDQIVIQQTQNQRIIPQTHTKGSYHTKHAPACLQ